MNAITREELAELLRSARIKLRIRQEVRFVPEEITNWEGRDFLAVTNRSCSEGVLIAPLDKLYVASFRLQKGCRTRQVKRKRLFATFAPHGNEA